MLYEFRVGFGYAMIIACSLLLGQSVNVDDYRITLDFSRL